VQTFVRISELSFVIEVNENIRRKLYMIRFPVTRILARFLTSLGK